MKHLQIGSVGLLVGDQYGGFWVDELDILPLLLTGGAPSCLVVDDHVFKSVFSFLFKSLSSDFVVFTNRENDGLPGFNSALDKYKNIFSCSGEKGEVVLVDRSTFNAGFVSVFASSESFFVDASCDRASLLMPLVEGDMFGLIVFRLQVNLPLGVRWLIIFPKKGLFLCE